MLKSANVELTGPMKGVGSALVSVTVTGDVAAVKSAIESVRKLPAATAVVSAHVIARPHDDTATVILLSSLLQSALLSKFSDGLGKSLVPSYRRKRMSPCGGTSSSWSAQCWLMHRIQANSTGSNTIVCIDTLGAGEGELLMFAQGSSARQAEGLKPLLSMQQLLALSMPSISLAKKHTRRRTVKTLER